MKTLDKLAELERYYGLELTSNVGAWYLFTTKLSDLGETCSFGWLPFEEIVSIAYDTLISGDAAT